MRNKSEKLTIDTVVRGVLNVPYRNRTRTQSDSGFKNHNLLRDNRYQQLFEASHDGICILNPNTGRIEDLNKAFVDLFGGAKENYLFKKIWDTDLCWKAGLDKKFFIRFKKYGNTNNRKIVLPIKDGRGTVSEFSSSLFGSIGERYLQCTFRNLTRQKDKILDLEKDLDNKDMMLKELQHRVKNTFFMITSLIELKSYESDSPETVHVLQELSVRVKSISDLYTLLYETESTDDVKMDTYSKMVGDSIMGKQNNISVEYAIDDIIIPAEIASSIGIILVELLYNVMKYAFPNRDKGSVKISMTKNSGTYRLMVSDNGRGLPEDFKIVNRNGSGLHLVQLMAQQLNGTAEFKSQAGTKAVVEFRI